MVERYKRNNKEYILQQTKRQTIKPTAEKNRGFWYLFVAPLIVGLILFHGYPIFESLRLSLYKTNLSLEVWRGLKNYEKVLNNEVFWQAVWNTVYMGFWQLLLSVPLAFCLASLIDRLKRGKNAIKTLYFIPYVTPMMAAAFVFLYVMDYQGLFNRFTSFFGIVAVEWLRWPLTAQWTVIIFSIWKGIGYTMMVVLSNLQAIPAEYYEAASMDGASELKAWWYITLPNMKHTLYFLFINGMIGLFQRFSDVFAMGGGGLQVGGGTSMGGPQRALYTIVMFIYERGFGSYDFGMASASANILFVMIFVLTLASVRATGLFSREGD